VLTALIASLSVYLVWWAEAGASLRSLWEIEVDPPRETDCPATLTELFVRSALSNVGAEPSTESASSPLPGPSLPLWNDVFPDIVVPDANVAPVSISPTSLCTAST
jgi:hypothetical protein